jgi:tetratricopeptide (TPR) repeat protein
LRDLRAYDRIRGQSQKDGGDIPTPRTAWEHYDMGRSYLRSGEYKPAEEEFRRAIALEPGEFWPHFFRGVCAYRLGRHQDALAALNICVALAPRTAECYYNRAKVYEAIGEDDEALADDSRALALNPAFASAALNRGILSLRRERYAQAIADFQLARTSATAPRSRGLIDYNLALVHVALEDWPTARACLRRAIEEGDVAARDLYARLGRK